MSDLPKFDEFLGPVLDLLSDGQERSSRDVVTQLADTMSISEEARAEMIPSGKQSRMKNRITWSLSYLGQAACLERPARGVYRITDRGQQLRTSRPDRITLADLETFSEFQEFKNRKGSRSSALGRTPDFVEQLTPLEQIAEAVDEIESSVAHELVARIRSMSPEFLEKAVLRLLVAMGYGGSEGDAQHIGGSGDGGFDGVINQDRLGLERIYVQAKRYAPDNVVGRPAVQGFLGALHGVGAAGGVFITTSRFSPDAILWANGTNPRVILIDGARLGSLMITYGVGVQSKQEFRVVELDEDFFE